MMEQFAASLGGAGAGPDQNELAMFMKQMESSEMGKQLMAEIAKDAARASEASGSQGAAAAAASSASAEPAPADFKGNVDAAMKMLSEGAENMSKGAGAGGLEGMFGDMDPKEMEEMDALMKQLMGGEGGGDENLDDMVQKMMGEC